MLPNPSDPNVILATATDAVCAAIAQPANVERHELAWTLAFGVAARWPVRARRALLPALQAHADRPWQSDPVPTLAGIREALIRF